MIITIEHYPEFLSIKTDKHNGCDKRVMIVRPGEHIIFNGKKFMYSELRNGPRIVNLASK